MFQRIQVGFHRSVVDTQELICGGHHVDTVGFAFRAFLVHELVNRLIHWSALQEDAHHQKILTSTTAPSMWISHCS